MRNIRITSLPKLFSMIGIILFFLFTSISCEYFKNKHENDCGNAGPMYYKVKTIGFNIGYMQEQIDSANYCLSQLGTPVNPCYINYRGGYVKASNLLIHVSPQTIYANLNQTEEVPFSFSFFNSAYACSPAEIPQTDQNIIDISIFSDHNFNNSFPANSNLIQLLEVKTDVRTPLSTYIANNNKAFLVESHGLTFNTSPAVQSMHVLTFVVTLSDSTKLSFNSDTLKLY